MKVRFKVSSLKFVRFFVESVDIIGSRKSEKLRRLVKVKRPSRSMRRKVNTTQIPLTNFFILFDRFYRQISTFFKYHIINNYWMRLSMISGIIKTSCLCYLSQPSASADNTDTRF